MVHGECNELARYALATVPALAILMIDVGAAAAAAAADATLC